MISTVGGLRGGAGSKAEGLSRFLDPLSITVEADDEDVDDSLTEERLCSCRKVGSSGVRCLVTGGLLCNGLVCLKRALLLVDKATPGEYDDMDVGVEETLNGPGDSE